MKYCLKLSLSPKRIIKKQQATHKIPSEKSLLSQSSKNSYLVETEYNSDVDIESRNAIEERYRKSTVNPSYVFPRKLNNLPMLAAPNRRNVTIPPIITSKQDYNLNLRNKHKDHHAALRSQPMSPLPSRQRSTAKTPSPMRRYINVTFSPKPTKMYALRKKLLKY